MKLYELVNYKDNYKKLKEIQNDRKNIIPFVGAGISIECGLYSWMDMLDRIAEKYFTADEIDGFHNSYNSFEYADKIVQSVDNQNMIMRDIKELFENVETTITLSPIILTSSFSDLIVTTNYDTILEKASCQNIEASKLLPLLPCLEGQFDDAIQSNGRCVLKLHGSIEETSSFILTTEQYNKFYDESEGNKPLPRYLRKLFSAKKLLFVGCSLENDRTLDILCECIKKGHKIYHYAIVPWIENEAKNKKRSRQLSNLGIVPIYYPEGEYDSVCKILIYLSEKNTFINQIEKVTKINFSEIESETITTITKEAYYNTSFIFPKILDDVFSPSLVEYENKLNNIMQTLSKKDTIYSIILRFFEIYLEIGTFDKKQETKEYFTEQLSEVCLKDKSIKYLLEKQWSTNDILIGVIDWENIHSHKEINDYASWLLQELQYKNGMSFEKIEPIYSLAKTFVDRFEDKLDYHIRTRLLNSIGAFSYYYNDSFVGGKYLKKAIELVNRREENERTEMLFLAKCYYNYALSNSNIGDLNKALDSIKRDIRIKNEFLENKQYLARSLDLYASILKILSPFESAAVYLEAAKIKQNYEFYSHDDKKLINDLIASWATAIFNIGLLCRDVELYELAYEYVNFANEIRFKVLDKCNRDYCSSLNVQAEIELMLNRTEKASNLIEIIDSKQDLPKGFDKIMGHTYYVCSLYYLVKKEYQMAYDYSQRSLNELLKNKSADFLQIVKTKLIQCFSLQYIQNSDKGLRYDSGIEILQQIVYDIKDAFGNDSYYLIYPYKLFRLFGDANYNKKYYEEECIRIKNEYENEKDNMRNNIDSYLNIIKNGSFL